MKIDPERILQKFYVPDSVTYRLLVVHGRQVGGKALAIADRVADLKPDRRLLWEAAMLHDIAIFMTAAPKLGCHGTHPYVSHGYLGRMLLETIGLKRHALICERHVGVGLDIQDIIKQNLPVPLRDMRPITLEEQIICYADKYFSKNGGINTHNSVNSILTKLRPYGVAKLERFETWIQRFGI
jgi:uncharacterized protein